jgi:hypothetical protein
MDNPIGSPIAVIAHGAQHCGDAALAAPGETRDTPMQNLSQRRPSPDGMDQRILKCFSARLAGHIHLNAKLHEDPRPLLVCDKKSVELRQ